MKRECVLKCGRDNPEGSAFDICPTCRGWLAKFSLLTSTEWREYQAWTEVRARRTRQVIGVHGEGPANGGYVAQLRVKRAARARAEREQRRQHANRKPKHFPSTATAG